MSNALMKPEDTFTSKTGATLMKTGSISSVMVFGAGLLPFIAMSWPLLMLFALLTVVGVIIY